MVAISLYRGDLHTVPDLPRTWLMPKPKISVKAFKSLIRKRDKALSRFLSTTTTTTTSSNPNPNPNPNNSGQEEEVGTNQITEPPTNPQLELTSLPSNNQTDCCVEEQHGRREIGDSDSTLDNTKSSVPVADCGQKVAGVTAEKPLVVSEPMPVEISNNVDMGDDKQKKKKDLEQKLQVLNETKHNLVLMLKQILNAEEEMKRRSSMQALVVHPPAPLQLEATSDIGSNPRHSVPRTCPEANSCGDLEGESEDVPNPQVQPFHQMRIASPSAPSPLRKAALSSLKHNTVPNTTRASSGAAGNSQTTSGILVGIAASPSPSRFAPVHQGHPANLPSLSASGTHFMASSPSPAASGGTSIFRDSRLTSPSWS